MSKYIGPFEPCANTTCAAAGGIMARTPVDEKDPEAKRDRIVHVAERAGAFWWQVWRPGCFAAEVRGSAPSMAAAQDAAAKAVEEVFAPKPASPELEDEVYAALNAVHRAKRNLRYIAESPLVTNKTSVWLTDDCVALEKALSVFTKFAEKLGMTFEIVEDEDAPDAA